MKTKKNNIDPEKRLTDEEENNLPGYPVYPESEDIYVKYEEDRNIDPEEISETDEFIAKHSGRTIKAKDLYDDLPGSDLDIPGFELDDNIEYTGDEDEENTYYSLGGEDHEDLEEYQGI